MLFSKLTLSDFLLAQFKCAVFLVLLISTVWQLKPGYLELSSVLNEETKSFHEQANVDISRIRIIKNIKIALDILNCPHALTDSLYSFLVPDR